MPRMPRTKVNQFGREVSSENLFLKHATDPMQQAHEESIHLRLDTLYEAAKAAGFASLNEAILLDARQAATTPRKSRRRSAWRQFADSGGMAELYRLSRCMHHANGAPSKQQEHHRQLVAESVAEILRKEVKDIKSCKELNKGPEDFTPEFLASFSFSEVYTTIQKKAPVMIALLDSLMGSDDASPEASDADDLQGVPEPVSHARHRRVVCSIAILLSNGPCNIVQAFFGYWLYSAGTSKRVIIIMNHIGLSVSYTTILRFLRSQADEVMKILRKLGDLGYAFQIVFDNVNWQMDVRYERLHNQVGFASGIAAFILIPWLLQKMFTHADIRAEEALTLTLADFLPLQHHITTLLASIRYSLFSVLKEFGEANDLPPLSFKIDAPEVEKLDPSHKPTIHCLPLIDLNEAKTDEIAEAIGRIRKYVGMSDRQTCENIILFKGDYMTVNNSRYVP